jgi:DNA helicase-2/ATP-dependent DNA helicase PcrA
MSSAIATTTNKNGTTDSLFPVSMDSALLEGLNPEQRMAVMLPAEHALILAGAGSGKTRVLTTRIAWLLETHQVSPSGVLAVTFTNKAAKEMLSRLSNMIPVSLRGMWIGTFHGLCNRMLRMHWKLADLPQTFQILDAQDQLSSIKRIYKQYGVDDEEFPAKKMVHFISACKEQGKRPSAVVMNPADVQGMQKVEIYELYEAQCKREGAVDFGELILRSYELLNNNPQIRQYYCQRFQHILIDEFQDTNPLQYKWIKTIAGWPESIQGTGPGGTVLAVGDDDQSIYSFRGARVDNMIDFVKEFEIKHQIKLEENYRSYESILDTANELISHNEQRLGKNLRTQRGKGEQVRVLGTADDFTEALWVVDEIKALVEQDGMKRSNIAVLYRNNAQSRIIESALVRAGIPYRVYGGLRFFERAEIKHALAYLRLLENSSDDNSFLRVVNFPPRGIGMRSLEQLQDVARAKSIPLTAAVSQLPAGKAATNLTAFVKRLDLLRQATQGKTLRQILELVLDESGLFEYYRGEKDGTERIENLQELVNAAESFVTLEGFGVDAIAMPLDELTGNQSNTGAVQEDSPAAWDNFLSEDSISPLVAFLAHASLEAGDNQAQAGQEAVQLMTVHASKGLEFDAVFLTGLEDGLFPHSNAIGQTEGVEEERRLMYVAITRAKSRLYLSHSYSRMINGQVRNNPRSRFVEELPEHSLKWLTSRSGFRGSNSHKKITKPDPKPAPKPESKPESSWNFDFDRIVRLAQSPVSVPAQKQVPAPQPVQSYTQQKTKPALTAVSLNAVPKTKSAPVPVSSYTEPSIKSVPNPASSFTVPKTRPQSQAVSSHTEPTIKSIPTVSTASKPASSFTVPKTKPQPQAVSSHAEPTVKSVPKPAASYVAPKTKPASVTATVSSYAEPTPQRVIAPTPSKNNPFRVGAKVFHAKFGEGTVLLSEGTGDNIRWKINFPRHGEKWLLQAVAKLTVIE